MPNETKEATKNGFESWVILELLGHRRLCGYLTEETIGGCSFLRIDVPVDGKVVTQYYSPSAVYAITPTTAETVHKLAHTNAPAPASAWEIAQPPQISDGMGKDEDDMDF